MDNNDIFDITDQILKILTLSSTNTGILCVDCQNGFTERCPDELPVEGTTEEWIDQLNNFLSVMRQNGFKIFASMDDHPENHMSFNKWPVHCVKGTYGNQLFIKTYDFLIKKGIHINGDSYSAFYKNILDNEPSELDNLLKENEIENLIVLGLAGDVCVISTIEDAIKRGYKVYPVSRFIKSVNKKSIKEIIEEKFGKIL